MSSKNNIKNFQILFFSNKNKKIINLKMEKKVARYRQLYILLIATML